MPLSKLEALRLNEWNRMIDVNIRGVLHGIAAALPVMQAQHHGQFINVASIGAHQVSPTAAVYSATKHAVWAISEGLRLEVGGGPCHHQGLLGEADADARRRRYAGGASPGRARRTGCRPRSRLGEWSCRPRHRHRSSRLTYA